jgi:hypothetical protein
MSDEFDHEQKHLDHLKERYGQLKSIRKTAEEFGMSKSTVHRKLKAEPDAE